MPDSGFWKDRQSEFEKYAMQFPDLKAFWRVAFGEWILWWGSMPEGQHVPQECEDIFKAVTRKAVSGLPGYSTADGAEPWRAWLDCMRRRGWGYRTTGNVACTELEWDAGVKDGRPLVQVRREQKYTTGDEWKKVYRRTKHGGLQRLSARELKGKSSEDLQRYYHWLEDGTIEHVFDSSARFCEELAAGAFNMEPAPAPPHQFLEHAAMDGFARHGTPTATTDTPESLCRIPGTGQSVDPCGDNPFATDDARHQVWAAATRRAEEELSRLKVELLGRRCASPKEMMDLLIAIDTGKFHIWAKRGVHVVWGDFNIPPYDDWLLQHAEVTLKNASEQCPGYISKADLLPELRLRLMQAVEYWKAEARRYVSRQPPEMSRGDEATPADAELMADQTNTKETILIAPFPNRASWLKARLRERKWNKHDLGRHGGPEHRTTQKILDGLPVRDDQLQKVAGALSLFTKLAPVTAERIPQS